MLVAGGRGIPGGQLSAAALRSCITPWFDGRAWIVRATRMTLGAEPLAEGETPAARGSAVDADAHRRPRLASPEGPTTPARSPRRTRRAAPRGCATPWRCRRSCGTQTAE